MLLTVGAKAEVGESAAYDIKNAAASFILGDYFAAFRKPEINSDEAHTGTSLAKRITARTNQIAGFADIIAVNSTFLVNS